MGYLIGHVPALVQDPTLHDGVLAEDARDPGGERLAAVDGAEESVLEAKPSIHEVGREVCDDRRVLDVALPDPDGDLRSCLSSSASLFSVAATKCLEIADVESPRATISRASPMGSATSAWRLVATPASMRSTATWVSRSRSLKPRRSRAASRRLRSSSPGDAGPGRCAAEDDRGDDLTRSRDRRSTERHQAVLDHLCDILQGDGGLGWQCSEACRLVPVRGGHDGQLLGAVHGGGPRPCRCSLAERLTPTSWQVSGGEPPPQFPQVRVNLRSAVP